MKKIGPLRVLSPLCIVIVFIVWPFKQNIFMLCRVRQVKGIIVDQATPVDGFLASFLYRFHFKI